MLAYVRLVHDLSIGCCVSLKGRLNYKAKVVTSSPETPDEVRVLGGVGFNDSAVPC